MLNLLFQGNCCNCNLHCFVIVVGVSDFAVAAVAAVAGVAAVAAVTAVVAIVKVKLFQKSLFGSFLRRRRNISGKVNFPYPRNCFKNPRDSDFIKKAIRSYA